VQSVASAIGAEGQGTSAAGTAESLPAAVSSALATNSAIAFEPGNGGTTFALGQLAASAEGTAVTQSESATTTIEVNTAMIASNGQVVLGLFGGAPTGGFTSLTFSVDAGLTQLITETFTSVAFAGSDGTLSGIGLKRKADIKSQSSYVGCQSSYLGCQSSYVGCLPKVVD